MDNDELEKNLFEHVQDLAKKTKREISLDENDGIYILHSLQV
jgi:hypothetical protein